MKYTVLVVGGAGYIGSHMVRQLVLSGHKVIVLDNLSTGHRDLLPESVFYKGSLGDPVVLNTIFSNHKIDAVMHFAAYSLVGESVRAPVVYYNNNVAQTIQLVNAMVINGIKKFIFSSTAAVYGEPEQVPIREDHPLQPTNPYGATKMAVERFLQDCHAAYELNFISLRYFNAAGADPAGDIGERHQPETHLIPLVLKAASGERENIQIFGTDYPTEDGTCVRDYIHVNDLANAHLIALNALMQGKTTGIYNLGNSKGYSVLQVIELAKQITKTNFSVIKDQRRPGDPAILIASSEKIKKELGWKPQFEDLGGIIESAWKWHQNDSSK